MRESTVTTKGKVMLHHPRIWMSDACLRGDHASCPGTVVSREGAIHAIRPCDCVHALHHERFETAPPPGAASRAARWFATAWRFLGDAW